MNARSKRSEEKKEKDPISKQNKNEYQVLIARILIEMKAYDRLLTHLKDSKKYRDYNEGCSSTS